MKYCEILAKRIIDLCRERNISINKLAKLAGCNQKTVNNIAKGVTDNPGIKTLHKIANTFGMTVSEFLNYKELNEAVVEDDK